MDNGPNPPPANPSDYGMSENSEDTPPLVEEAKQEFDAVAEFTVPVELDQKMNGAPAASPKARTAESLPRIADGSVDRRRVSAGVAGPGPSASSVRRSPSGRSSLRTSFSAGWW